MQAYPRFITKIEHLDWLAPGEREALQAVAVKYPFRANEYYLSLIDWDDPEDPIRRIVVPHTEELEDWGDLDASEEYRYTHAPGLQHKYGETALILASEVCGAICRFCFRKRGFMKRDPGRGRDLDAAVEYVRAHPELTNVLLTGGDPLFLPTPRLESLVRRLREIPHVKILRIGSKMLAYNPYRVLDDPSLLEMFSRYSRPGRKMYVMTHFNHPRELTEQAVSAIDLLGRSGVVVANQTPILRGVNDDAAVLTELFRKLSFAGAAPYYVFICRPTAGNRRFAVPVERAYDLFQRAIMDCSGLAKRAKLVMSHSSGKIEVVGRTEDQIFFRYHRSADPKRESGFMVFKGNPEALWFDDYVEREVAHWPGRGYHCYGPE